MNQLFRLPLPQTTWRFFWPVLACALALRFLLAQTNFDYIHPDQTFQYLEPAYRLVHGYGLVTWEWAFGIRSWFVPFGIAGVIRLADWIGVPHEPLVELAFSLISLAIPVGIYRLAQALLPERQAIWAFLVGCFWIYFLHAAATPMPSMLASAPLIWVAVLMLRPPTRQRLLLIGALAALTLAIRYQLLPVVGLLMLFSLIALRWQAVWIAAGGIAVLAVVGLVDLFTWGVPFWSFVENFRLNMVAGLSERFGVHPQWFYLWKALQETGGVFIAMLVGLALMGRNGWPIWVAVAVGIAFFHIPAHKEIRFLTWAMPFGAIGFAHLAARLLDRVRDIRPLAMAVACFMPFWIVATGLVYLPFHLRLFGMQHEGIDATEVMRFLSTERDATAVLTLAPEFGWWRTGGYYTLARPLPVYFAYHGLTLETAGPAISHVVTDGDEGPAGFEPVFVGPRLQVWRSTASRIEPAERDYLFRPDADFDKNVPVAPLATPYPPIPTRFPDPAP